MSKKLKIFISYRRADSTDFAGRLHDNLKDKYHLFFDTEDGIGAGERFLNVIVKNIEEADVFLMVIGKASAQEFKAREGQDDYVLKEIVQAQKSSCFIIPVLMGGVDAIEYLPQEIASVKELSYYAFSHVKFSLNIEGLKQEIDKCTPKKNATMNESIFLQEVQDSIERDRLLVLFSQDFTKIEHHYDAVKEQVLLKFPNTFYGLSIPSFVDNEEEYFSCIAKECGLNCEVKKASDWNFAMRARLKESQEDLLLFITDIENGNETLDKQFATILRNLKNEFSHFHAILIGRKDLAKLVYGESELSPLNSAKELFFPDEGLKLGEAKIAQQFQTMGKNREELCNLLQKEKLGRFSVWSYNETVNKLFWKNLLVRDNNYFVWRGELTKSIGREVLECESN